MRMYLEKSFAPNCILQNALVSKAKVMDEDGNWKVVKQKQYYCY